MKKSRKIYIIIGIAYLVFVGVITLYAALTYPDRLPKVYLCRPQSDTVSYEHTVKARINGSSYYTEGSGYGNVISLTLDIVEVPEEFLEEGQIIRVKTAESGEMQGVVIAQEIDAAEDGYGGTMDVMIGVESEREDLDGIEASVYIEGERGPFPYVVPGTAIYRGMEYPDVLYFVIEQAGPFGYEYVLREEMVSRWPQVEAAERYAVYTTAEIKYPVVGYSEDFIYDGATVKIERGEELENER